MKVTDMIISAILKKGILYEARNVDTVLEVPYTPASVNGEVQKDKIVRINIKAEHVTLKVEKENEAK